MTDTIKLIIVIGIMAVAIGYFAGALQSAQKIQTIKDRMADTEKQILEYEHELSNKDREIARARDAIDGKDKRIEELSRAEAEAQKRIEELESSKFDQALAVNAINNDDALLDKFKAAFPQFTRAPNYGIVNVENDDGLKMPYITFPFDYVTAFINHKQELDTANKQLEEYGGIDKIRAKLDELQNDRARLQRQVAEYQAQKFTACDDVRKDMQGDLNQCRNEHIETLSRPRFDMGNKLWFGAGFIGGGVAGYFIADQMCDGGPTINLQRQF